MIPAIKEKVAKEENSDKIDAGKTISIDSNPSAPAFGNGKYEN